MTTISIKNTLNQDTKLYVCILNNYWLHTRQISLIMKFVTFTSNRKENNNNNVTKQTKRIIIKYTVCVQLNY